LLLPSFSLNPNLVILSEVAHSTVSRAVEGPAVAFAVVFVLPFVILNAAELCISLLYP